MVDPTQIMDSKLVTQLVEDHLVEQRSLELAKELARRVVSMTTHRNAMWDRFLMLMARASLLRDYGPQGHEFKDLQITDVAPLTPGPKQTWWDGRECSEQVRKECHLVCETLEVLLDNGTASYYDEDALELFQAILMIAANGVMDSHEIHEKQLLENACWVEKKKCLCPILLLPHQGHLIPSNIHVLIQTKGIRKIDRKELCQNRNGLKHLVSDYHIENEGLRI